MQTSKWRSVVGIFIPTVLPVQEKQYNLDELLTKLPPEAREAAEIGAVKAGFSASPDYAAKASIFYADKGSSYEEMARLEILKGNPEGAIAIYEGGHFFVEQAAEVAKDHISINRAIQIYEKAIEREDNGRYHEKLMSLYAEIGDLAAAKIHLQQAITRYGKSGSVDRAVSLEREYGTLDKVIEIYVRVAESNESNHNRASYYHYGAKVAEEIGEEKKAHQLYEKSLDALLEDRFLFYPETLINLAKKVGNEEKLITVYELVSQPIEAYKLALQGNKIDRAMNICLKVRVTDDLAKMAKFALEKDQAEMAIKIYEHAGLDKDAARTAYTTGNPQKALDICEEKMNSLQVNGNFGDADYFEIAMDAATKMGDEEKIKSIGNKAMQRFSVLGKFAVSAKFAEKLGHSEIADTYRMLASLPKV